MNDINTSNLEGETLSVNLGSVQEAMNISGNIKEEAIETTSGEKVYQNRTASVQVPASVFQDLGQSSGQQRLSYAVFVRDTLFQSSEENQSNLTVGSIIVAVRVNGTTAREITNYSYISSKRGGWETRIICLYTIEIQY